MEYLLDKNFVILSTELTGWWLDCGTFDDLLLVNQKVMKSKFRDLENQNIPFPHGSEIIVGENSKIIDSVIKGPVIIGENCLVENSIIEKNTSIKSNSIVINSKVKNSILMSNVKIKNLSLISDSIIGNDCNIESKKSRESFSRLILGNNTKKILD